MNKLLEAKAAWGPEKETAVGYRFRRAVEYGETVSSEYAPELPDSITMGRIGIHIQNLKKDRTKTKCLTTPILSVHASAY